MEAGVDSPALGYLHLGIVAGGRDLRGKEARRIGLPVTLGLTASGDDEVAIWKTCLRLIPPNSQKLKRFCRPQETWFRTGIVGWGSIRTWSAHLAIALTAERQSTHRPS